MEKKHRCSHRQFTKPSQTPVSTRKLPTRKTGSNWHAFHLTSSKRMIQYVQHILIGEISCVAQEHCRSHSRNKLKHDKHGYTRGSINHRNVEDTLRNNAAGYEQHQHTMNVITPHRSSRYSTPSSKVAWTDAHGIQAKTNTNTGHQEIQHPSDIPRYVHSRQSVSSNPLWQTGKRRASAKVFETSDDNMIYWADHVSHILSVLDS